MTAKNNFRLMKGGKGKSLSANKQKWDPKTGKKAVLAALLVFLCLFVGGGVYVLGRYRVENIIVDGNLHYSDEEIIAMVLTDKLSYNSLYLSIKYRDREIQNIPFIEKMNIKVVSQDTIQIHVYEKSVAGYVEYMGRCLYFDREGMVVESSETKTAGVPEVTGMIFDHVVLYEPLPVEDPAIFQKILSVTQMLSKYEIMADRIFFNASQDITLYFGQVRVRLGKENLEEKIIRLQHILPSLEGEAGVVRMENYTEESPNITFEKDRDAMQIPETQEDGSQIPETQTQAGGE